MLLTLAVYVWIRFLVYFLKFVKNMVQNQSLLSSNPLSWFTVFFPMLSRRLIVKALRTLRLVLFFSLAKIWGFQWISCPVSMTCCASADNLPLPTSALSCVLLLYGSSHLRTSSRNRRIPKRKQLQVAILLKCYPLPSFISVRFLVLVVHAVPMSSGTNTRRIALLTPLMYGVVAHMVGEVSEWWLSRGFCLASFFIFAGIFIVYVSGNSQDIH